MQALRLALLALDGGITLEPFSDYVVLSFEVGLLCCAVLCCAASHWSPSADYVVLSFEVGLLWRAALRCITHAVPFTHCTVALPASLLPLIWVSMPAPESKSLCAGSLLEQPSLALDHRGQQRVVHLVRLVSWLPCVPRCAGAAGPGLAVVRVCALLVCGTQPT